MNMNHVAMLMIEMQNALVEKNPYNILTTLKHIKEVLEFVKEQGGHIIYIRQNDGPGKELQANTRSWNIHVSVEPRSNDMIIDKKYPSAFKETKLKEYLDQNNINTLILVGLKTDQAMDATIKVAYEYGYEIIIPKHTNTTFFNDYLSGEGVYNYFNYHLWDHHYVQVLDFKTLQDKFKN